MNSVINVIKIFSAEERMTREGGEKLRKMILELSKKNASITLSFQNKTIASVSFWDEGIAKLILEGWSTDEIKKKIQLFEIHKRDKEIIAELIKTRAEK